jgi:hypothetical protein
MPESYHPVVGRAECSASEVGSSGDVGDSGRLGSNLNNWKNSDHYLERFVPFTCALVKLAFARLTSLLWSFSSYVYKGHEDKDLDQSKSILKKSPLGESETCSESFFTRS